MPVHARRLSGDKVRQFRQAREETVADLARNTGLSLRYCYDLEGNIRPNPSAETVARLADALDVPVERLMVLAEVPRRSAPAGAS